MDVIAKRSGIDEKLSATIAQPKTQRIGVAMGVQRRHAVGGRIRDDNQFICLATMRCEYIIATLRKGT